MKKAMKPLTDGLRQALEEQLKNMEERIINRFQTKQSQDKTSKKTSLLQSESLSLKIIK